MSGSSPRWSSGRRAGRRSCRDRLELDGRGDPADPVRRPGRGRRRPAGRPLLQPAQPGGLYRHFAAVAESVDLPLVLYNIPGRTGRNIEPETVERLAKLGPIVAIKEAGGSLDQVSELVIRTDLTVLSGDDSLTLPMLAVGAEGVVSVVANLVPRDVMALIDAFLEGQLDEARGRHARLFPLCRDLLGLAPNPSR